MRLGAVWPPRDIGSGGTLTSVPNPLARRIAFQP